MIRIICSICGEKITVTKMIQSGKNLRIKCPECLSILKVGDQKPWKPGSKEVELLNLDPYDYEGLVDALKNAPISYLPALFITITEECIRRPVFRDRDVFHKILDQVIDSVIILGGENAKDQKKRKAAKDQA